LSVGHAREAKVGNGFGQGVRFGPVNNKPQFERIVDLVEDAVGRANDSHFGLDGSVDPVPGRACPPRPKPDSRRSAHHLHRT